MRRKFLAPALVFIMCIGITMTAYASPQADQLQNQPQFTTNATSEELSIIKTLFSAEEYAELYPDVVKAYGNEEAALWDHFAAHGLSEGSIREQSYCLLYPLCHSWNAGKQINYNSSSGCKSRHNGNRTTWTGNCQTGTRCDYSD